MQIVHHAHLKPHRADGELSFAAADASLGVRGFEVWMWRLEPGVHGVECSHDGELVALVLSGCGKLLLDGGPQRFAAPCTVIVPPRRSYQFVNHGCEPMQLVLVRSPSPAPLRPAP
jgi:oxalate decarboxylase/phosphoglucose isomerase-like protein (cupin superfamily)